MHPVPGVYPTDKTLKPKIPRPSYVLEMLKQGQNPKEKVMADCRPKCQGWEDKLHRCEAKLKDLIKINPTKTCLYRMRDWVTCVEACTQPTIHNVLKGTD